VFSFRSYIYERLHPHSTIEVIMKLNTKNASETTAATGVESEPPLKEFDREKMIADECQRLEKWYKETGGIRPKWELPVYVGRVLDAHIGLAARFGGWRYHSRPYGHMPLDLRTLETLVQTHQNKWAKGITLYENLRPGTPTYRPPEKLAPVPMRHWQNDVDELYCATLNCCFPAPMANLDLWRDRVFKAPDGGKEANMEYAARRFVKVRTGQAPSRAVLAEVRKVFAEFPLYVKMWETLCEAIGVAWAGSRGIPISFSFAPSDFIRLGHMDEGGSCYQTGGGYEFSKLNLSLIEDSLVVMFYDEYEKDLETIPSAMEPRTERLRATSPRQTGRCWAILDVKNAGGVFSNAYRQLFPQTSPSIAACLNQLFGWDGVQPGQPTGGALEALSGYAFVNKDQHIVLASVNGDGNFIGKKAKSPGAVKDSTRGKIVGMIEKKWYHKLYTCNGCQGRYGGMEGFKTCKQCGTQVCYNCALEKTECCGQDCCASCRKGRGAACAGCNKSTCGKCPGFKYEMCVETRKQYCKECAPKFLFKCKHKDCKTVTSNPHRCHVDCDSTYCQKHGMEDHRSCNRCMKPTCLKHVTRCPACKMRRCDTCMKEGETKKSRTLCRVCVDAGVIPPKPVEEEGPTEEVVARFKRTLDTLPIDVKDDIAGALLDLYEWDADALLEDNV
jgi:hypothetical protein